MNRYNKDLIEELVDFIKANDNLSKDQLSKEVATKFNLQSDRSIYWCSDFAIRFSKADTLDKFRNCIVGLKKIKEYDDRPIISCVVTKNGNYLFLMNSTFIEKVSHSSIKLEVNHLCGTLLGSNIMKSYEGTKNSDRNFEYLFSKHTCFEDNIERIVNNTHNISGKGEYVLSDEETTILNTSCIDTAINFQNSEEFIDLQSDLDERVEKVKDKILIASKINNVNIRGRLIEYLITSDEDVSSKVLDAIMNNEEQLSKLYTANDLGDYSKSYSNYETKVDIKSKLIFLNSCPKGYNIDKLLQFLSENDKNVYLLYIVGIDQDSIKTRLISVFDKKLIEITHFENHWAGRDSRGTAQFTEKLVDLLDDNYISQIDKNIAYDYIQKMINNK